MLPWIFWPWYAPFRAAGSSPAPLSGDVNQDIAPLTNWFSPQVALNFAGDRRVERDVVAEVASYGRQLGILTDAVLAVAGENNEPAVTRLRQTRDAVEVVKARHQRSALRRAEEALAHLRHADPESFKTLISELQEESSRDTQG